MQAKSLALIYKIHKKLWDPYKSNQHSTYTLANKDTFHELTYKDHHHFENPLSLKE